MPRILGIAVAALFLFPSCMTVDHTYASIATYTPTGKERHREPALAVDVEASRFELRSSRAPGLTVEGIAAPASDGRTQLIVTDARIFANWANGWTEGLYEASGLLYLTPRSPFDRDSAGGTQREYGTTDRHASRSNTTPKDSPPPQSDAQRGPSRRRFRVVVAEPIELWSLQTGEIRYYDTYFQGEEGTSAVAGRVDRITAITDWLNETEGRPFFDERLYVYLDKIPDEEAPEWLQALRESNSIARDRREAPGLFPLFFNLDHLNREYFASLTLEAY